MLFPISISSLFNEAEIGQDISVSESAADSIAVTVKTYLRKKKRSKEELYKDLPEKEIVYELPEESLTDAAGNHYAYMGKEQVRKEIEIIPRQMRILVHSRKVYTYTITEEGNIIIGLFSRKVIAYRTSIRADSHLVMDTFLSAFNKRKPQPDTFIFHSDRGYRYSSKSFRNLLDSCHVTQSFSAPGYSFDNAVAESSFKFLKKEETNRKNFSSIQELNLSIFQYIEGFYNPVRPHSANDMLSPDEMEVKFRYDNILN